MIVESQEHSYEIIRKLDMGRLITYFEGLCTEEKTRVLLAGCDQEEWILKLLSWISEKKEAGELSDLQEIIPDQKGLWLVFPYPSGISLADYVKTDPLLLERFEAGSAFMEEALIKLVPPEVLRAVFQEKLIFLDPDERKKAGFLYNIEDIDLEERVSYPEVFLRLYHLLAPLFLKEASNGLYPEITEFLHRLKEGAYSDLMGCYQDYMKLLPVCMTERFPEKKKKERFRFFKKLWKHKGVFLAFFAAMFFVGSCLAAGPFIWKQAVFPYIQSKYLVKTMSFDDPETAAYSGRVLLTDPETDLLVFTGILREGRRQGPGKVYASEGRLIFDGQFMDDRYEGMGISYNTDQTVEYEGEFSKGKYQGQGIFNGPDGVTYEGEFAGGRYNGEGRLWKAGELIYEGSFKNGMYDGEGILYQKGQVVEKGTFVSGRLQEGNAVWYDENGRISYEGEIQAGRMEGQGTAYENGMRVYTGAFEHGLYEGEGMLYSPNTGGLIYEGAFLEGQFSGQGRLYEPGRQYLIYEGSFRLGQFDGEGKEYDEDGSLRYEGGFKLGIYHGKGIYYEPATGLVLEDGEFRNGYLATPIEELKQQREAIAEGGEKTDINIEESAGISGITPEGSNSAAETGGSVESAQNENGTDGKKTGQEETIEENPETEPLMEDTALQNGTKEDNSNGAETGTVTGPGFPKENSETAGN